MTKLRDVTAAPRVSSILMKPRQGSCDTIREGFDRNLAARAKSPLPSPRSHRRSHPHHNPPPHLSNPKFRNIFATHRSLPSSMFPSPQQLYALLRHRRHQRTRNQRLCHLHRKFEPLDRFTIQPCSLSLFEDFVSLLIGRVRFERRGVDQRSVISHRSAMSAEDAR